MWSWRRDISLYRLRSIHAHPARKERGEPGDRSSCHFSRMRETVPKPIVAPDINADECWAKDLIDGCAPEGKSVLRSQSQFLFFTAICSRIEENLPIGYSRRAERRFPTSFSGYIHFHSSSALGIPIQYFRPACKKTLSPAWQKLLLLCFSHRSFQPMN
jgi:hypothetical protein